MTTFIDRLFGRASEAKASRAGAAAGDGDGGVGVGRCDGRAKSIQAQAVGGQRPDVSLNAHGRPLPTAERDQAHPIDLTDFQSQAGVDQVLDFG